MTTQPALAVQVEGSCSATDRQALPEDSLRPTSSASLAPVVEPHCQHWLLGARTPQGCILGMPWSCFCPSLCRDRVTFPGWTLLSAWCTDCERAACTVWFTGRSSFQTTSSWTPPTPTSLSLSFWPLIIPTGFSFVLFCSSVR